MEVRFNCGTISDIRQADKLCAITQSRMQALFGWEGEGNADAASSLPLYAEIIR